MSEIDLSSQKTVDEINKFRLSMGMGPVVRKTRECLRCGKVFESQGRGHRTCGCIKVEDER